MIARRLALFAAAALALGACNQSADAAKPGASANGPAGKFTAPEYVMGNAKAPVTVVEYLSNTCSHCAHFDLTYFPQIKKDYIDAGKVKWVIREFLTDPVQVSAPGFVLARCAGRDKYWGVVESLFATQKELFQSGDARGYLYKTGKAAGMTDAQINTCLADDQAYKDLNARVEKAVNQDKITGTPTFVINGKQLQPGVTLGGERFDGTDLKPAMFADAYRQAGGK